MEHPSSSTHGESEQRHHPRRDLGRTQVHIGRRSRFTRNLKKTSRSHDSRPKVRYILRSISKWQSTRCRLWGDRLLTRSVSWRKARKGQVLPSGTAGTSCAILLIGLSLEPRIVRQPWISSKKTRRYDDAIGSIPGRKTSRIFRMES
jgi:hypothetical protein